MNKIDRDGLIWGVPDIKRREDVGPDCYGPHCYYNANDPIRNLTVEDLVNIGTVGADLLEIFICARFKLCSPPIIFIPDDMPDALLDKNQNPGNTDLMCRV